MEQVIWYSIPGAIVLFAIGLAIPGLTSGSNSGAVVAAMIAGTPVVGFIIHQLFRSLFELVGGFEAPWRPVLKKIRNKYNPPDKVWPTAFVIWELTFYTADIPSDFRDHNRGAWHYIMSFGSACIASIFGICILSWLPNHLDSTVNHILLYYVIFGFTALMFAVKAFLTTGSTYRQEEAAFEIYSEFFDRTASKLNIIKSPALQDQSKLELQSVKSDE